MAKRLGTVLVFRAGTTKSQAEEAIRHLRQFLDPEMRLSGTIREFDDRDGGPVWYVP